MRVFSVCVSTRWITSTFLVILYSTTFCRCLGRVLIVSLMAYTIATIVWISHLLIILAAMKTRMHLRGTVSRWCICCIWHIIKRLPIRS